MSDLENSKIQKIDAIEVEACLTWAQRELEPCSQIVKADDSNLAQASFSAESYSQEDGRLDAEVLLAHVLQKTRTWLRVWPEHALDAAQRQQFQSFIQRRQLGEPVAYIIGYKEFWSLNFKVSPDTLVPRPDTEVLVETALSILPQNKALKVADLGTGSGAIAIAIASERSQAQVFALDYSSQAIDIAEYNKQNLKISNVECLQGNWLNGWDKGQLDMIVSNPPYVAAGDPHLSSLSFEPYQALVADEQGFADYKIIIKQAKNHLKPLAWLVFEHGFEQAEYLSKLMLKNNFSNIETIKDYGGNPRVTFGQLKK